VFNEAPVVPSGALLGMGSPLSCVTPVPRGPCPHGRDRFAESEVVPTGWDPLCCSERVWGRSPELVSGRGGALLAFDVSGVPAVQTERVAGGGSCIMQGSGKPVSELNLRRFEK